MSSNFPATMWSLCVNSYRDPSKYEISSIPTPKITSPSHVLVKVHAASINPADVAVGNGTFKWVVKLTFPLKLGLDLSGTVVAIGGAVKEFNVGEEVFGCLIFQEMGAMSEFVVVTDTYLVPKPKNISHVEAASMPVVSLTAVQSFAKVKGGIEGKTVLISAGLGGVGSAANQIAKNVYRAKKVITTVSTERGKVEQLIGEGVVDQIVDYKTSNPLNEIPHSSVDVLLDNSHVAASYLPLLSKGCGTVIDVKESSSGKDVKNILPEVSIIVQMILNISYYYQKFRIGYLGGVQYESILQKPTREGMLSIASWIEEGKLRLVVGKTVRLEHISAVREAFTQASSGKGGTGKVVIEIV